MIPSISSLKTGGNQPIIGRVLFQAEENSVMVEAHSSTFCGDWYAVKFDMFPEHPDESQVIIHSLTGDGRRVHLWAKDALALAALINRELGEKP
jgi:hypothetical protein